MKDILHIVIDSLLFKNSSKFEWAMGAVIWVSLLTMFFAVYKIVELHFVKL
jgi:hypothetical protein